MNTLKGLKWLGFTLLGLVIISVPLAMASLWAAQEFQNRSLQVNPVGAEGELIDMVLPSWKMAQMDGLTPAGGIAAVDPNNGQLTPAGGIAAIDPSNGSRVTPAGGIAAIDPNNGQLTPAGGIAAIDPSNGSRVTPAGGIAAMGLDHGQLTPAGGMAGIDPNW